MIKDSKAYKYACWCIEEDNQYVGIYVKKQAKSWTDIVNDNNDEAYVDEKAYKKICKLLKLMIHPDLGGKITIYEGMEDYAWFFVVAILCTRYKKDDSRYYETGLLEISRKNFKTFVSAIIFIIGMLIEPQFSRFFSVAPDYKLSSELRLAVRKIIKVSPALVKYFKINRDLISCKITESEYVPLAYSNDGMDGKLANIFLADEAGALDDYPVEAMRSSQITLINKLGIIISTQYPNDNNVMIDEIDYAKKVLDELIDDKRYFSLLYEPNDNLRKKWQTNDLVIYQSNPVAYSTERVFEAIKKKRTTAVLYENKRENYLCKHNNIQYKGLGTEGYVDINIVKECRIIENLEFWIGKSVYIGLDLSQTDDNTSVAMVTEYEGYLYAKVWAFIPSNKVEAKSNKEGVDYKKMIKEKTCFKCGDDAIDYSHVEDFIMKMEEQFKVTILQIGYDVYNCMSTAQKLEAKGYEMVQVKQHSSILHAPTKLLLEFILHRTFKYFTNRLYEINFQNARCTEDTNKNKYVNKKKSTGKVDMVISTIIAVYLLQQAQLNNVDPNKAFKENYSM
ncbi:terminase TerL endonuclease subunit [Clostridium botulinum]|uniref:terminase TerL endonuclease subunit n=1 Tax=Clostridium botulinum TaxID=1491 RepID=UPI00077403F5|nr:terminase TerL endonuclease subunit [Clostridium botulinum]MBY6932264.1 terminase [Clostridium botulinum]NFG22168.1 terminase [Clostridium botulinum]NFL39671.1 terminase [Clostridium botulinum]NFL66509.1 terminase [Clostridium botulinum]NFN09543.1 terminase [Clostridium botulinum]